MTRHIAFRLLSMACIVLLGACDAGPPAGSRLLPDDAPTVALGRKVYDAQCAACHGAQLQGQPNWRERDATGRLPAPPHDATGHTWHHPDEVLFRLTKLGVARAANLKDYVSAMPAYEGVLSDAEIVAVLSYIKSQWPADIRRKHDELNASAAAQKP
ncbi:cytochrome c [Ramlibacter sp. PS3R-8]|uniref:c-type cytochrome n=1 Tax=Ramlibacter sp. PS3R-8 TaxID=3133437 RepID=UPI003096A692